MPDSEEQNSEVSRDFPSVPSEIPATAGYVRSILSNVESSLVSLRSDMRSVKDDVRSLTEHVNATERERHTEARFVLAAFAAGFVLLAAMFIAGYLLIDSKIGQMSSTLGNKIESLSAGEVKVETKLDDLIQRIPPLQQSPQRH